MLTESKVEIIDPLPQPIDSFYLDLLDDQIELSIVTVSEFQSFDILIELFDPVQQTLIDTSLLKMGEDDRVSQNRFSKKVSQTQFSNGAVYIFSAFIDEDKVPIHCRSSSCILYTPSEQDLHPLYDL